MKSIRIIGILTIGTGLLLSGDLFAQSTQGGIINGRILGAPLPPSAAPTGGAKAGGDGAAGAKGAAGSYSGGDLLLTDAGVKRKMPNIPEFHLVKKGDTMWDICEYYYADPWAWPQLWANNKSITNPHWIYPGDKVRLLEQAKTEKKNFTVITQSGTRRYDPGPVMLKQHAFADNKEIKASGKITGSKQENIMLSTYHEIYIEGDEEFKPQVGASYTIYKELRSLKDGDNKIGKVVEVLGTARVKRVNKNNVATAEIVEALNRISRGDKAGPLRRLFKRLPKRPARKDLAGRVLDFLRDGTYVSQDDLVFLNRGSEDGVRQGNRFLVMRRGDGYRRNMVDDEKDHKDWPREAIAEIAVLDVRKKASVGLITRSRKEIRKGDYVRMKRGY